MTTDCQTSSPASVNSSTDASSQHAPAEELVPAQEDVKMEVKKEKEEEDEGTDVKEEEQKEKKEGKDQCDMKMEDKPEVKAF